MSRVVLVACAVAFGLVLALRRCCTYATVRGRSMSPTFADGERVLAVRRRRYRVGDVVVFRTPASRMVEGEPNWRIKRVVAVAGDPNPWCTGGGLPARVPADRLAVAGDGIRSEDSRQLGFVALTDVAGRVVPARPS